MYTTTPMNKELWGSIMRTLDRAADDLQQQFDPFIDPTEEEYDRLTDADHQRIDQLHNALKLTDKASEALFLYGRSCGWNRKDWR